MQNLRLNIITPTPAERLEQILTSLPLSVVKKQPQVPNFGVTRFTHPDLIKFKDNDHTILANLRFPLWRDVVTLYDTSKTGSYGNSDIETKLWLMGKCIDEELEGEAPSEYSNPNQHLRLIEYVFPTNLGSESRMFSGFLRRRREHNLRLGFARSIVERLSKCGVPFFVLEGDHWGRGYRVLCENGIDGPGYFSYADKRIDRKLVPV